MKTLYRLFLISRPFFWIQLAGIYWWGFLRGGEQTTWATWLGVIFMTFPMGLIICGINDIYDQKSDAQNTRKGSLDGAVVRSNEVRLLKQIIPILSVVFVAAFLIGGYYAQALAISGIVVFAYAYSARPIRLKSRPILDSISNGLWIDLVFYAGYYANQKGISLHLPTERYLIIFFLAGFCLHAFGSLPDYEVDKKAGDKTIGLFLGKRFTAALCGIAYSACIILSHTLVIKSYFIVAALLSYLTALWPSKVLILQAPRLIGVLVIAIWGYAFFV